MTRRMVERRRQRLAQRGRRWWEELSEPEREAWRQANAEARQRAQQTINQRYPFRAAQYADFDRARSAGEITPDPCPGCGGPGRPELVFDDQHDDPTAWRIVGWRCYPCRKEPSDV